MWANLTARNVTKCSAEGPVPAAMNNNRIVLTKEGLAATGTHPYTAEQPIDMWRGNLSGGTRRIFDFLVASNGLSNQSGTRGNVDEIDFRRRGEGTLGSGTLAGLLGKSQAAQQQAPQRERGNRKMRRFFSHGGASRGYLKFR